MHSLPVINILDIHGTEVSWMQCERGDKKPADMMEFTFKELSLFMETKIQIDLDSRGNYLLVQSLKF